GLGRGFIEGWWTSDEPDAVVRVLIRNLSKLDGARNRLHRRTSWATDRIRQMLPHAGRARNREDISAHYDIGNPFFELFLDETMTYSSGIFPSADATLAEASLHKYDVLLDKLGVTAEHRLLEIGTGWGGMAIRAASTTGCHVTTTTISAEQLSEAERRIDDAGVTDQVTLLSADWRDLSGQFDRVVSIEMIEAVDWRDYDAYFSTIERCLVPGGSAAIQAICIPDERWERAKNTKDFIRRLVFPNGFLPSVAAIERSLARATKMGIVNVQDLTPHYAETLRHWRNRFDSRIDDVAALGLDERFQRLWRFYLAYCEAAFRERHITVVHIVISDDA
ncbi:MAG: cyclopropane-fatty-acyl-phospholipid synthase, partial [Myxococcota bacterium]